MPLKSVYLDLKGIFTIYLNIFLNYSSFEFSIKIPSFDTVISKLGSIYVIAKLLSVFFLP